jgi:hypothetical protein
MSDIKEKLKQKIKQKLNKEKEKQKKYDPLFDNPTFVEMKNALPTEEQKKYEEQGKYMYSQLDEFDEKGEMNAAIDTVSQIKLMLRSGLHPSFLEKEEKEFLTNYLGKEWYKEFGYLENDLNRINM